MTFVSRQIAATRAPPLAPNDQCPTVEATRATILVVDDEQAVREIVAEVLSHAGYHVLEAAGGLEALAMLRRNTAVDLLFTDIRMPGLDGFELAEVAQRLRPDLNVLFTTGYSVRQPHPDAGVLQKPFRAHQLLAAVHGALAGPGGGRRAVREGISG